MAVLHPVDYVVFVVLILASVAIGVFHAFRGNKTSEDYLVGNRQLGFFPVSMSFTASLYSAIIIIGQPADVYTTGAIHWLFAAAVVMSAIIASLVFVPVLYPLKLTSVNTYLKIRFKSNTVALLGTLSNILTMVPITGVVCVGPALAINAFTGFPVWASVLIGNAFAVVYTAFGGIKAVIWTDVFQLLLMFAGVLAVAIKAVLEVGGIGRVMDVCEEKGRLNFQDIDPDPTVRITIWGVLFGFGFLEVLRYGVGQSSVQRYVSLPTIRQAYLCVLSVIPLMVIMVTLTVISGLAMFVYFDDRKCDPLSGGIIHNMNQLILYFVIKVVNIPSIPGLLLAGITSASLSSASSMLNACAANLSDDVLLKIWPEISDRKRVLITKVLVLVIGGLATAICFVALEMGGTLITIVITFVSACMGPTGSLFLIGVFFPFVNWIGAIVGVLIGVIFALWKSFGAQIANIDTTVFLPTTIENCSFYGLQDTLNHTSIWSTSTIPMTSVISTQTTSEEGALHDFYSISYLWVALFSAIITSVTAIIISLLTGCSRGEEVDPRCLHPIVRACRPKPPPVMDPSAEELLAMTNKSNTPKPEMA